MINGYGYDICEWKNDLTKRGIATKSVRGCVRHSPVLNIYSGPRVAEGGCSREAFLQG